MTDFNSIFAIAALVSLTVLSGCDGRSKEISTAASASFDADSYLKRRESFKTKLLYKSEAPQEWEEFPIPDGFEKVQYKSNGLKLVAYVAAPKNQHGERHPAVAYFHGGFSLGAEDFAQTEQFVRAGFVVLMPTLRAENGNPGNFEMLLGEVDDAAAAIQWLADQPHTDPKRIYAFGHSLGGAVSAILALQVDVPIVHSGSVGGIYDAEMLSGFAEIAPFDMSDADERSMRMLVGNVRYLQRKHFAFVGTEDGYDYVRQVTGDEIANSRLELAPVTGDHFESVDPAVAGYIKLIADQ